MLISGIALADYHVHDESSRLSAVAKSVLIDWNNWDVLNLVINLNNQLILFDPENIQSVDTHSRTIVAPLESELIESDIVHSRPFRQYDQHDTSSKSTVPSSLETLIDCSVFAKDGEVGHIKDVFIDFDSWSVQLLLSDSRNWVPMMGKDVLVPPNFISSGGANQNNISINLTRNQIRLCPDIKLCNGLIEADDFDRLNCYFGSIVNN